MKKYLFLYAVLITALLAYGYTRYRHETRRLTQNQNALASGIEHYRTRLGQEAASVQALRLRCAEFERLRAGDADTIRRLSFGQAAAVQYSSLSMMLAVRLDPLGVSTLDALRSQILSDMKGEELNDALAAYGAQLDSTLSSSAMSKLPASKIVNATSANS